MRKEKICGIYCIENKKNGKKYVGSSNDVHSRWLHHKSSLLNGKHHSKHLQKSYNKYGSDCFEYYILEKCNLHKLIEREQYWIDKYDVTNKKFGYNIAPVAGRGSYLGASFDDLKNGKYSISLEEFYNVCFLLQTSDISIKDISNITEVSVDTIYSVYQKKNYSRLTSEMKFLKRRIDCQYNGNTIITEDMAKNVITELQNAKTIYEIAKLTGVNRGTVADIKYHHSWKELTKNIVFPKVKSIHPNKRVAILQFDKNFNFIARFESISDAVNELNINSNGNICACLNGKRKSAYGYIWKYAS